VSDDSLRLKDALATIENLRGALERAIRDSASARSARKESDVVQKLSEETDYLRAALREEQATSAHAEAEVVRLRARCEHAESDVASDIRALRLRIEAIEALVNP
jgi:glutamine synthetase type III